MIERINSKRIPTSIAVRRNKASINELDILQTNEPFNSPSYAASFVLGGHVNGLTEWKTIDGKTLKELESSK